MNTNLANDADGPMTPELHLKMSKKIAQLTKVVYALNTKNDEHDAHVSCLQEAHELELKKVLASAEEQVAKLQSIVANQRNDKEAIIELRNRIKQYELNNQNSAKDYQKYKSFTQDREDELKKGFEEQMRTLKIEMEAVKSDYESKIVELTDRSSQQDVSSSMLRKLKEKHDKELELLKEVAEQQLTSHEKNLSELTKKHEAEVSELQHKHREEMAAIVSSEKMSLSSLHKNQITQLEEQVSTLKQLMESSEFQNNNKLALLTKELEEAEAKFAHYFKEREELQNENEKLKESVREMENKFLDTREELQKALKKLTQVEHEVQTTKSNAQVQQEEIMKKAGKLSELDEKTQLHTVENERLQFEITKLKDQLGEKDEKITSIKEKHGKTIGIWEEKSNQLKKDLAAKEEEINLLKAEYKLSLEEHAATATEREAELQRGKLEELRVLKESCDKELDEALEAARANTLAIREALETEAISDKQAITELFEKQMSTLKEERDRLASQVKEMTDELARIKDLMANSQTSLSGFENERNSLKASLAENQERLEILHGELKDKISLLRSLREEFDKEVKDHATTKKQRDQYVADQAAIRAKERDEFWAKKLRDELESLELELMRRQSQSRSSEIKKIKDSHMLEFVDAENVWKEKVETLQAKVKDLEKQVNLMNIENLKKEMSLNEQSKSEYEELTSKMQQLKAEHAENIKEIEAEHKEAIKRLEESMTRDAKTLEDKIVFSHRQNIHEMTKAHKLSVDVLKEQLEQKRVIDLNAFKHAARKELEAQLIKCKKECGEQNELRLHELTIRYEEQKEELQRELEMREREMKSTTERIDEVQSALTDKRMALRERQDEVMELKNQLQVMKQEVEEKSKEVMAIKQEAVIQIKKREKKLTSLHQSELNGVHQKFLKEVDELKFKQQNEIEEIRLQIGELNHQLKMSDDRYNSRPSRPEDINKIQELENTIMDHVERIKHLMDEKKFFELELVNRESNYNKMFSTAPKIGVINPMNVRTKITKKTRSDTAMRPPASSMSQKGGLTANSFSSPILPNTNNRKPQTLEPISDSRTSSLESIVAHTINSGNGPHSVMGTTTRRVVKNAFLDNSSDAVVPPT